MTGWARDFSPLLYLTHCPLDYPAFCSVGTGFFFGGGGVKRPGREFNQSLPFGIEVKNQWSCTSALPMLLSLHLGYEAGVLAARTIISIVKLKEPTELMCESDRSRDLFFVEWKRNLVAHGDAREEK